MTEARADQLCDVFGISAIRNKYPAEISGGEKQRTAVARALINHPLLILADEPTGNLDSKSSRAVIRSFEQAKSALEATIFMVTHGITNHRNNQIAIIQRNGNTDIDMFLEQDIISLYR